jgi:hypothetical protein
MVESYLYLDGFGDHLTSNLDGFGDHLEIRF